MSALTRRILWLIRQAENDLQDPMIPKTDYVSSLRYAMLKNDIKELVQKAEEEERQATSNTLRDRLN